MERCELIYMHLYTHIAHMCMKPTTIQTCALGALDKASPQIFTKYGAVTRHLLNELSTWIEGV